MICVLLVLLWEDGEAVGLERGLDASFGPEEDEDGEGDVGDEADGCVDDVRPRGVEGEK